MGERRKLTVLMPVFNAQRFLELALDSIFEQSFEDFELLLIDDASTDGSREIIQAYRDLRVILRFKVHHLFAFQSAPL